MKFGAEIVPYYKPEKLEKLAVQIEKEGFDYLWVSDHYHNRFVHSILTRILDKTDEIKLGPGVTNPYLIHPSVTAAAVATLDELSGGRATLGISSGDPAFLESVGIEHEKPITAVREAIKIIRSLLKGEKVNFSGERFECHNAKLGFSPVHEIPIYIGGRGPQMMRLAGSLADGALYNAAHPKDIEECLELVEEGAKREDRDLEGFHSVPYIATSIADDEEEAREKAKSVTSFVAASAPESTIEREGISKESIKQIRKYLMSGDLGDARREVSGKMVDVFSVSGTIDRLEDRLEEFQDMGIEEVVIGSPIGPDTYSALDKISEVIKRFS